LDQIGRQGRQAIMSVLGPTIFQRHVLPDGMAAFRETALEHGQTELVGLARAGAQPADHWHFRLLRARRERPCCRAAAQRDELATFHSITSSARASKVGGMAISRALAVFRLMASSNFVGCTIGRSAGFSPFSTRPT